MGTTPSEEFERLTAPLRRKLVAHCYRMTGSADEAEDLVQQTYLRAWRSYARFEGRSSLRTWLYRISTNACLRAIERRGRRALPAGLGPPGDDPEGPVGSPNVVNRPGSKPAVLGGRPGETAAGPGA